MKNNFEMEFFDCNSKKIGFFQKYDYRNIYPLFRMMAGVIKNLFNPKRTLDLGCAKGFFVKAFRDLGVESYGVDISQYAISKAPESLKPFLFISDLNSDKLPFEDNFFDTVTFLGTIEYLSEHEHALTEINRVSKMGSTMIIKTLFKKHQQDRIRINVHKRNFWINELGFFGFAFSQANTNLFYRLYVNNRIQIYLRTQTGFRKKVGPFLLNSFPYGRELIHLYLNNFHSGYLIFSKLHEIL